MSENLGTFWVCESCIFHLANGECGDCHREEGHDEEPLNAFKGYHVTSGMARDEHSCRPEDCELGCDCEIRVFSITQCGGCGSYLHGGRHAVTVWT